MVLRAPFLVLNRYDRKVLGESGSSGAPGRAKRRGVGHTETMATRVIESIEELKNLEGEELGVSDWLEVTQEQIHRFADLTQDHQWIHIDPERAARESPYKATIAHGFFTLSLISTLSKQVMVLRGDFRRLINYGLNKVRFPAPVPAGSRIRGRFAVQSVREVAAGAEIVWRVAVEGEHSAKPCLIAEWVTRAYS